jgi:hypothetical protein
MKLNIQTKIIHNAYMKFHNLQALNNFFLNYLFLIFDINFIPVNDT